MGDGIIKMRIIIWFISLGRIYRSFMFISVSHVITLHALHQVIKLPTTPYRIPIFQHMKNIFE